MLIAIALCVPEHSYGSAELTAILPAGQSNTGSPCKGYPPGAGAFFQSWKSAVHLLRLCCSSTLPSPLLPATCSRHLPGAKTIEKYCADL